jgi:peptidoglycan/xylan/chitin deacetylase (PgdA/CDA1 family)
MKERSVGFYKRLIISVICAAILVPTGLAIILLFENSSMKSKLDFAEGVADDAVTVGTTQIEPASIARDEPVLSYQTLYPDFKARFFGFNRDLASDKSVFLTFDDGPSPGTAEILDVLKKHEVPATFFINGKTNRLLADQLKRIVAEGHSIGMHSYSHRYNVIYESMENLLDDLYRNYAFIESETGIAPEILRFPGGSINIFNISMYQAMVAEVLRRGFIYYDWNVSAGDAAAGATAQSVANNVIHGVRLRWGPAFVLMHDNGSPALRDALGTIIETLGKEGYVFQKLDNSIKPPMFIYPD